MFALNYATVVKSKKEEYTFQGSQIKNAKNENALMVKVIFAKRRQVRLQKLLNIPV